MINITDVLIDKIESTKNPTVVGLDPRLEYLPEPLLKSVKSKESAAKAVLEFNCRIIDSIKDVVPAVKLQSAFYELHSHYGVLAMEQTAEYAKKNGLIVMADVKRNDIGPTAEAYAQSYLGDGEFYDYITVNPYPGYDGIKPFADMCEQHGKGIFVLARMSNPSAAQLQNLVADGKPIYIHVGELIQEWGKSAIGKYGYSAVGAVVGATNPAEAKALREKFKSVFFLVPGYGAQGGKGKDAAASFDSNGRGAIVNNSRGIIAAYKTDKYKGMEYYAAAREAALAMQSDLMSALGK